MTGAGRSGPDWRVYRPASRPPPRPVAGPDAAGTVLHGPSERQLAAFARRVLAMHQPQPVAPARIPECSCGSPVVLCPYRSAATRYPGPPRTGP